MKNQYTTEEKIEWFTLKLVEAELKAKRFKKILTQLKTKLAEEKSNKEKSR